MLRLHQCLSSFPLLVVLVSAVHGEGFTRKVVLHVDRSRRESGREGGFPNRFQQISPSRLERRVMACHSMSVGWRRTLLFVLGVRPRHVVDRRCVSAAGIWRLVTVLALVLLLLLHVNTGTHNLQAPLYVASTAGASCEVRSLLVGAHVREDFLLRNGSLIFVRGLNCRYVRHNCY